MPKPSSIVFGALVVAGLAVIAVSEYYPSSPMFETLGIDGPRANSGRVCGHPYRMAQVMDLRIRVPLRALNCKHVFRWAPAMQLEEVDIDGVNRELVHAQRMWPLSDSTRWQSARDSIAKRLVDLGGLEIICYKSRYALPHIRNTRYWRFPNYSVRLIAYKMEEMRPENPWWLQLDGYPELPMECTYDPWAGL